MNTLTIVVLLGVVVWWYKPLRMLIIQRTNRVFKTLLVLFPLFFAFRVGYRIYAGQQDQSDIVALTVTLMLIAWLSLVSFSNWLEKRRPTQAQAPDFTMLSRIPGVPRVPQVPVTPDQVQRAAQVAAQAAPHVQRMARLAAEAAANVEWDNVAGQVGRTSGRFVGKLKRSLKASAAASKPS